MTGCRPHGAQEVTDAIMAGYHAYSGDSFRCCKFYPRWPKSTIIPPRTDTNDIFKRADKESQCHEQQPLPSCATSAKHSKSKTKTGNAQTPRILILFGRQTTVLTDVDGTRHLQPGRSPIMVHVNLTSDQPSRIPRKVTASFNFFNARKQSIFGAIFDLMAQGSLVNGFTPLCQLLS